jgi:xanthine dehydrogenase YagR molybdenum-binding subunit
MAEQTFAFGVVEPGGEPGTVSRELPEGEPAPWPHNAKLGVVGKPTPRLDGVAKVTGAATFTADVRLPGMLHARVMRSPHPHARIRSIDTSLAERHPGVRAVHVLEHLRGVPSMGESGHPRLRYAGQPIAAVAAVREIDAEEALKLVRVDYEVLPFVADLDAARRPDAPLVFSAPVDQQGSAGGGGAARGLPQNGNVRGPQKSGPDGPPSGDVDKGFAEADVIVEATYRTQVQTHSALETHGVVVDYKPDQLTVYASTQGTSTVRDELAEVFGIDKAKIRVVAEFIGGGFGAKFGIGNFGVLATHLSKKAGAPVRLMLDRREEHLSVGNRPNSEQRLRIGAKNDGTLTAIHLVSYGTAGAGTGAGSGGPAKNMYPCPNILAEEYDVFTHLGPAAAFRAPGHPQGCFALEQTMDALAEKIGMDPLALRDHVDVDPSPEGKLYDSASRRLERKIGAARIGWDKRHGPGADAGPIKRGVGMAQSIWYRIVDLDASVEVRILRDGSVVLLSAVQDIGTGTRTALAQVVAEELGLRAHDVTVRIGDTAYPIGPASGGSKTIDSITPAARNAAHQARRAFVAEMAAAHGVAGAAIRLEGGQVHLGDKTLPFRSAAAKLRKEQVAALASRSDDYGGFSSGGGRRGIGHGGMGGVQFASVRVDVETGIIGVERIVAVHDCGRPINPLAVESQIHGGVIQGLSYALYEDRVIDRGGGHMLNANLESYKIAGAREIPDIDVVLLEEYRGRTSTDASGIGEPATVPTAAAIANAVYNAIGVRIRELPMTPARVLRALAQEAAR